MRAQFDLFSEGPAPIAVLREAPYQARSETSRSAAALVRPRAKPQRERVLDHLRAAGPRTMHELHEELRIPLQSICGRISELKELGLVCDSGATRETPSGKRASVWRVR